MSIGESYTFLLIQKRFPKHIWYQKSIKTDRFSGPIYHEIYLWIWLISVEKSIRDDHNLLCFSQLCVFFTTLSVLHNFECSSQLWVLFATLSVLYNFEFFTTLSFSQLWVIFATLSVLPNLECSSQRWVFFTTLSVLHKFVCSSKFCQFLKTLSVSLYFVCSSQLCLFLASFNQSDAPWGYHANANSIMFNGFSYVAHLLIIHIEDISNVIDEVSKKYLSIVSGVLQQGKFNNLGQDYQRSVIWVLTSQKL